MRHVCTVLCALVAVVSLEGAADAQTIWLQREDAGARVQLKWKGFDGKWRSASDAVSRTLASGTTGVLEACARAIPSEGDNTIASFCAAFQHHENGIELGSSGDVVEDNFGMPFSSKTEVGALMTFTVEGRGVQVSMGFFSNGRSKVDYVLYDHNLRQEVTSVTNQSEPTESTWDLRDGGKYTLAVKLSASDVYGIENGFYAQFATSDAAVPIQIVP